MRIVIGNSNLASYPQGGGHWSWGLQYLLGLAALDHDVTWLELLARTDVVEQDHSRIDRFFERMREFGVAERCVLVLVRAGDSIEQGEVFGRSAAALRSTIRDADVLWNLGLSVKEPLLSQFRCRAMLDGDPGQLQAAAVQWDIPLPDHDIWFTVGQKINDPDCEVPRLGIEWIPVAPIVHLPMWPAQPAPRDGAPFSSITHWAWGQGDALVDGRMVSVSKRVGYLRYVGLPAATQRPFELAADVPAEPYFADREILEHHGWRVVHPWQVTASPCDYQEFIVKSYAEFACPKPLYRELRTGWFSDRSACYLATARPVIMEDTGVGDHVDVGEGLLMFTSFDEARDLIGRVTRDYDRHADAARHLAEQTFDASRVLALMVDACR
jgi:hypothetical protein